MSRMSSFGLIIAIQTEAEFSYAIAVMDKIGGWEAGNDQDKITGWMQDLRQACVYLTKAVVCNGQRNMQTFRVSKMNSIMEAVNWACDDFPDYHDLVSEFSLALEDTRVLELFNKDIEVTLAWCSGRCCGSRN